MLTDILMRGVVRLLHLGLLDGRTPGLCGFIHWKNGKCCIRVLVVGGLRGNL
jgi:hypothetical protein